MITPYCFKNNEIVSPESRRMTSALFDPFNGHGRDSYASAIANKPVQISLFGLAIVTAPTAPRGETKSNEGHGFCRAVETSELDGFRLRKCHPMFHLNAQKLCF